MAQQEQLFRLVLAIKLLIAFLALSPFILLLLIARELTSIVAKLWDPAIVSLVAGSESVYAVRNKTGRYGYIVTYLVLENGNEQTVPQLQDMFARTVMKARDDKGSGELLYKRYCQYSVPFGGFAFWKTDTGFSVRNHIREYDHVGKLSLPSPICFEDMPNVVTNLQYSPMCPNQSPWELLVIRNVKCGEDPNQAKTILLLRSDHLLADGLSVISTARCFFNMECCDPAPKSISAGKKKAPLFEKIFFTLRCFYDFAHLQIQFWNKKPLKWTGKKHIRAAMCGTSSSIPFKKIKDIKTKYGVSVNTVLQAINLEAVLRTLEEFGNCIPGALSATVLLPLPNRPKTPGTYVTGIPLLFSTDGRTAQDRLFQIHREYEQQHRMRPTGPQAAWAVIYALGYLPFMWRERVRVYFSSGLDIPLCSIPMVCLPETVSGLKCLDGFTFLSSAKSGIQCITASWNDRLRFTHSTRDFADPGFISRLSANIETVIDELLTATN